MNRLMLILIVILFSGGVILPQRTLPTLEHFDYAADELRIVGAPDWTRLFATTGNDLLVVPGNLTYFDSNYPMPATGNRIQIVTNNSDDCKLTFTSQSGNGTKVYASFLLNVTNSTGLQSGAGQVFAGIGEGTDNPNLRLWIRNGSVTGTNFNLGLSKSSNFPSGYTGDLSLNTTYLIVVCYEFVTSINIVDDIVKLWVNPDLLTTEPPPTISGTDASVADNTFIDGFFIRQAFGTPNAYIDALRISTSWAQSPLPVELSSFSASTIGTTVILSWTTETEVNNYGFEIERSALSAERQAWEKIGFVNGNGNSNAPKDYSFEDKTQTIGKYSYRLKQIDNDGQSEYSKTIEVNLGETRKFELNQNYPNPFNPKTTIRFNLPEASNIKLTLYNILGQEIRTLVNEFKEAGVYTINFDASDLNSGMFIYKIEANGLTQTRKMTLVK